MRVNCEFLSVKINYDKLLPHGKIKVFFCLFLLPFLRLSTTSNENYFSRSNIWLSSAPSSTHCKRCININRHDRAAIFFFMSSYIDRYFSLLISSCSLSFNLSIFSQYFYILFPSAPPSPSHSFFYYDFHFLIVLTFWFSFIFYLICISTSFSCFNWLNILCEYHFS